ncbi:cupin domain-containing protein [Staphylococcus pettenkoferi]
MVEAKRWVEQLGLNAHPEGGYYKEIIKDESRPSERPAYTSIYFLLTQSNISHFHRIDSDEIWYYHAGDSLTVHMIHPDGKYEKVTIGPNIDQGDVLQYVVPKGTIFGSNIEVGDYALVGCMCQPGFDFNQFELFSKETLNDQYPHLKEVNDIMALDAQDLEEA